MVITFFVGIFSLSGEYDHADSESREFPNGSYWKLDSSLFGFLSNRFEPCNCNGFGNMYMLE